MIDKKLELAGWTLQDMKQLNLAAATGVAFANTPSTLVSVLLERIWIERASRAESSGKGRRNGRKKYA